MWYPLFIASSVYMTDAPPPYPGLIPNTPMYTPPENAATQQMPAAYYDPNKPNTAYAAASAPPAYEEANLYEKKIHYFSTLLDTLQLKNAVENFCSLW